MHDGYGNQLCLSICHANNIGKFIPFSRLKYASLALNSPNLKTVAIYGDKEVLHACLLVFVPPPPPPGKYPLYGSLNYCCPVFSVVIVEGISFGLRVLRIVEALWFAYGY